MAKKLQGLVVKQWLADWESVTFDDAQKRCKPDNKFFLFQIPAKDLKKLSDVHRRSADKPRRLDTGIQRKHITERSDEIAEFIKGGFPWSILSKAKRQSKEFEDLRMPGWLPTAIIANIKSPGTIRAGKELKKNDSIIVSESGNGIANITLPEGFKKRGWQPTAKPIEIIDGQHRLLAFDETADPDGTYELPVVAFYDLDTTWQAYLFYVINIKPKKINTSLAYDLYPILRIQDWLEKSPEGVMIYRETRAQELTEILWSHENSVWRNRINMLGDDKKAPVTQAAFIRSLTNSFIKSWGGPRTKIGGLFGAKIAYIDDDILYWSRIQQGAFLILIWEKIAEAIKVTKADWARVLRTEINDREVQIDNPLKQDFAFISEYSLLATDQGVRGILQVSNDLCYVGAQKLRLLDWEFSYTSDDINLPKITEALKSLRKHVISKFFGEVFTILADFDWRTSSAPRLKEQERINQMAFRGSGGYKELRRQLLIKLINSKKPLISDLADSIFKYLGY